MRKLVTLRTIGSIIPIEGADKIEVAHIGGWPCVVSKGDNFKVGQQVLYFEIDSLLPLHDCPFEPELFSFLEPRGAKEYKGRLCHRLKTAKLRGQISQGLVMPVPENLDISDPTRDFSEVFGVTKYEPSLPEELRGLVRPFPGWITKTDQPRVQNFEPEMLSAILAERENYIATEKLDGASCTIFAKSPDTDDPLPLIGVCSRNYQIMDMGSPFRALATTRRIPTRDGLVSPWNYLANLILAGHQTAVLQGEYIGPKIQKNPLKREEDEIWFFNFILDGRTVPYQEIQDNFHELLECWVPVYDSLTLPNSVDEMVSQVDKLKSKLTPSCQAEGIVWHHKAQPDLQVGDEIVKSSFKCINNTYLLKHD